MADLPPYPGAPRWVKVSGIVAIILVLLVVAVVFTGIGGPHGPGRHMPSSGVTETGVQQR
ncbi:MULTISPECIES: hypothetical protein [unclassified Mesorhizobium]|uniref:hypothetical protein n=1 Tax=unclassified Mesorhizobium TaxID=325217 RepID=UPI0003CFB664|nr:MULTISPECIES: hypothetical protein [unclassified Mesorhizobium]ESZ20122.1 hypothetical protein X737_09740 [Mesorhizobium sp. L48C026A00]RWN56673.1 MAG: hypothetical protein EOR98_09085 [Mesorhizobium sp.]RWN60590.1 MAG: hypothetical protein EOS00_15380 [Mesorhizobium sp.]RWN78184.1 MAG: hypothetical protein EOS02_10565 [Mesorhizobium sp.]RWN82125.1 MAG: hypothetical protein EOS01_09140 [Mesorhizobium sp.]